MTKAKGNTTKGDAPKRRMLTAEERVAKLEAELAAARDKAQAKDRKALDQVNEKIDKVNTKLKEWGDTHDALIEERKVLEERLGGLAAAYPAPDNEAVAPGNPEG